MKADHYPEIQIDTLRFVKAGADYEKTGQAILVFLDRKGALLHLRLEGKAIRRLKEILAADPQSEEPEQSP